MGGEKVTKGLVELPPPAQLPVVYSTWEPHPGIPIVLDRLISLTLWWEQAMKLVIGIKTLDLILKKQKIFSCELVFGPRFGVLLSHWDLGHLRAHKAPSRDVARVWTEKPHLAGTANDYYSSVQQLEAFRKHLGIKSTSKSLPVFDAGSEESRQAILSIAHTTEPTAWIDTYYPLLNYPKERKLEILNEDGTPFWSANVEEAPAEGDPAGQWYDTIGGKLVHVGYGRKQDFDELAAAAAQEAGAVGVLIYSDPRDNGAVTVENGYEYWPNGPALNPDSVQRGSVLFLSTYPGRSLIVSPSHALTISFQGDPGTPGTPAYPNANRTEGTNIPSIPSLPISWANAQVLLKELGRNDSIFSSRKIRLLNRVKNEIKPIWNTMAVIPGHIRNEVVLLGNHRDAWVLGASDPTSGTVSVHEIAKGFGKLLKQGWKPLRTIVFASWDAEEYGLIGSTEWGEDFADWIQEHVVAYLNVDVASAGDRFGLSGSPSLAHILRQAAIDVPHPSDANRTLWDARDDLGPFTGPIDKDAFIVQQEAELARNAASGTGVSPLGSGSDYTVFLQRLGIASSDEAFSGTSQSAVYHYHSIWDSQTWMEKYGDPGQFSQGTRHVAIAKHLGLVLLRLADSIVLPLNTPNFTDLRHAITKVKKASKKLDDRKAVAEHRLKRALEKVIHREKQGACSHRKFAGARAWIKKVFGVHEEKKSSYPQKWPKGARATPRIGRLPAWVDEQHERTKEHDHEERGQHRNIRKLIRAVKEVQVVNKKLSTFEQGFLSGEGIKDRECQRLRAEVGPYTKRSMQGYGATTLPALTEAITIEKNATLVAREAERLTHLLEKLAKSLN
ncbi:vacuolar protein sorting-associated protein 70 [Rhizoctonia solani AG-1 IA]|uniref:Vacuolar protein sorting-associated protein 70 n=1 Tax=Thanatephorus cucumeris (strain AG1-IA) TaxID=983506 RepID=L8WZE2_THACA|nr:vacuolar protein sorting-associated protein 70 [Rhizoctonia solani AG-1 IA]